MNLSRKDFFRKGLYSLVETLGTVGGATRTSPPVESVDPEGEDERDFVPAPRDDLVAVADNGLCLAGGCGCFSCEESCEAEAVSVVMGEGVRIDAERCTGCGTCEHVCPVAPKAIRLKPRMNYEG